MSYQYRKTKSQEDSFTVALELNKSFAIKPYSVEQLADVIRSGVRSGEIRIKKEGRSNSMVNVEEWFNDRLMPGTVSIPVKSYKQALYSAFRLVILGNIAKTDFGSSRQRDFGQMLTDFTRGFLGEAAIKIFFNDRFGLKIDLEETEIGDVAKFLPTDIVQVWENEKPRVPKLNFSIKTSKLPSLWLDIAKGQISHSDVFCFIKVGLTVNHFATFLKESGFLQTLVEIGHEVGQVKESEMEKELNLLITAIPDIEPWPAYIPGYVTRKELEKGELLVENRKSKSLVVGGMGYFGKVLAKEVEGLGEINKDKFLSSTGVLHWNQTSWEQIINSI